MRLADEAVVPAPVVEVQGTSPAPFAVRLSISVLVDGGPATAGTVSVAQDGTVVDPTLPLSEGVAVFSASGVAPGPHVYTVTYSGTDTLGPASAEAQVTVLGRAASSLSVAASSPSTRLVQLEATVTAEGEPVTEGSVDVSEAGKVIALDIPVTDGAAIVRKTGVAPGTHTYTVTYSGTDRIAPSIAKVPITVWDLATIAVSSQSAAVGKLVLTAKVTAAGKPVTGGTVTVKEGTKTLKAKIKVSRGTAIWSTSGLKSGKHTYTVTYSGNTTTKRASTTHSATVKAKVKPALRLSASSPSANKVTVKVAVSASGQRSLGGSVRIKEGRKTVKAKILVKRGKASWSAGKIKPGRHTYTVSYSGTSQVTSGSAKVTVSVQKPVAVKEYRNCTELNKVHQHGVGRAGAKDKVLPGNVPVTNFLVHTALYKKNAKSDRDKDGVACEQH